MKKTLSIILALLLLLSPAAVYAQSTSSSSQKPMKSLTSAQLLKKQPRKSLKGTADYLDPSIYPLVSSGGLAGSLIDSYNTEQDVYFNKVGTSPQDSTKADVQLTYLSGDPYTKDNYLTIEFYTQSGSTLTDQGSLDFDTYGYDSAYIDSYIPKSVFSNQPYIYMRLGVYDNPYSSYYSDVMTFKVANPFYTSGGTQTTADKYAVISNESTYTGSTESTGTLDVKKMKVSMDKNLKQSAYQIDYVKPFDSAANKGKLIRKSMNSILPSYTVGDYKDFWVSNMEYGTYSQISSRLAYSGTKANVWVYDNQISDADAAKLGQEFDNKIYSTVTSNFGPESDVNHDGKVDILCYDIQDGFSGNGAYIAGYFDPSDLYNTSTSNKEEIFYIDTYPAMGMSSSKDVTAVYSTLAHEFQHMVDYNRNVLVEGGSQMDTWLDEGLSMASEQIYDGHGLSDRLSYYNSSPGVQDGQSLLYWDYNGETLANYALSYLFVQYVKTQCGQGDKIFKEILQDPNNNYKAIENVAKKYIDPNITFGKLMTDFRIALLLKQSTGLYGFKGDTFFNALKTPIYSGTSASLRGGGAVVTTVSAANAVAPSDKGQDVTYNFFNVGGSQADTTPPASPTVSPVGDSDTQITGKAEANTTVYATVGQTEIGRTTNATGSFTIPISKQKAGTVIQVYAQDAAGNVSKAASVTVSDKTPPAPPTVNNVGDSDRVVTGQSEAGATIKVTVNGSSIGSASAGTNGKFSVAISAQKAGTKLAVTATDKAGNTSQPTTIAVKDVTAPAKPVVYPVTNKDTSVTGQAEAGSKIAIQANGAVIASGTAGSDSKFAVTLANTQPAGTALIVTATDTAGNISTAAQVVVTDATVPMRPTVNQVTDKDSAVTGQADAGMKIVVRVNGALIGSTTSGSDGKFTVTLAKAQPAGTVLSVTATNAAGTASAAALVVVKDATAPEKPTVNQVTDRDTSVTGQAEAGSQVVVKGNGKVIGTATAGSNGKFTVKILAQAGGTQLTITAVDKAGNTSAAATITVVKTKQSGWVTNNGKRYYYDPKTYTVKKGWFKVGTSWYYANTNGVIQTGWFKQGKAWYYFNTDGTMKTGWLKQGKTWYYFNNSGVMVTGWVTISGKKYYFYSNGALK